MKLYLLTTGSHSSYTILGVYIGPDGVDIKALATKWTIENPDKYVKPWSTLSGKKYFDHEHLLEYILREGKLIKIDHDELWTPDYALDMKYNLGIEQP